MNPFRLLVARSVLVLVTAGLWTSASVAQTVPLAVDFPMSGITYDGEIPRPEEVIGHVVGTRHTTPHQVVDYFKAVAEVSDRVVLRQHGETYEGRPLIHAVVTSPGNHARLEEIRAANLRLSDDPDNVSDQDLESMPVIAYQGYSIHGNEASGTEASLVYLYHLAAGRGAAVDDALNNAVLIVDPLFNPDGRDRFADWVNRNRGAVHTTDGQDREHNEPWPGGRTNHYFFDLNRDWLPAQLKESQARIELFHNWRPQVLTDHHEMGSNSTFFFQPGIPSRTNLNTPPRNQELTGMIAEYHAEQLDAIGSLYYSEESFDDFYYGKGSTFPDINGSVGILFEQASSRSLETETQTGTLHYAFTAKNQFATSLSTLKAVTSLRTELLGYQRDFYSGADDFARESGINAYLISDGGSAGRASGLIEILRRHRIDVFQLARTVETDGLSFDAEHSYIVPLAQKQARLIEAVMEETDTFVDSLFYDVSAWTLPRAFNLPFAEWRSNTRGLIGDPVDEASRSGGRILGSASPHAYLVPWGEYYLPKELYTVQDKGVHVRMATQAFSSDIDGVRRDFEPGTLIIPANQDGVSASDIRTAVGALAQAVGIDVYAPSTGLTPSGPDLGTGTAPVLDKPRIAILSGSGSSSGSVGEIWHLLSERFRLPVSLLEVDRVGRSDLDRYNVIVTTGSGGDADALKAWVRSGGTLIATGGGTSWVASNDFANLERRDFDTDSLLAGLPYDDLSATRGAQSLGGSIFSATVDVTHPLAYGYDRSVPLFRRGTTFFDKPDAPGTAVATYDDQPLVSGYATSHHLEAASGAMAVASFGMGRGNVVTIADSPAFRAFWWGPSSFLLNAVFLTQVY